MTAGGGVITLGETMALFRATSLGGIDLVSDFQLGIGGAESNVAVGLARLGTPVTWLGRVGLPGVLDGRHTFVVEPLAADRSRLVHSEALSGALVPLCRRMLTVDTPAAFSRMNAELAARVTAA